jgi:cytochrome c
MKTLSTLLFLSIIFLACSPGENQDKTGSTESAEETGTSSHGFGPISSIELNAPLNPEMVARGQTLYEMRCAACHKLGDQFIIGPGWEGLTERRSPEWIMNMILNVDEMLLKDSEAQELLRDCLVRMPDQDLTETEARDLLEFIFANDGLEVGS